MKKARELVSFILVIVILFAMMPACLAAENAVVSGETTEAASGREIEYRVSINGNPGLAGLNLRLRFDLSVFSLVRDEENKEIICTQGDFTSSGNMICAETDDGCQILWTDTKDISADGLLFTLKLQINDNAQPGVYPIKIENISRNTINKNEELIMLNCVSGSITVREFCPTIYGENATAKQGKEFDYLIRLRDNPGIAAFDVLIQFDSSVLSLVRDKDSGNYADVASEQFSSGSLVCKAYENAAEVFWHTTKDIAAEGDLLILHFKVKDDAPLCVIPISITCIGENTQNVAEQIVSFASQSAEVSIQSGVDVNISFDDAGGAVIRVKNAENKYIAVAIYEKNCQMLAADIKWNITDETIYLRSNKQGSAAICRVMILDKTFTPVSPEFWMENDNMQEEA